MKHQRRPRQQASDSGLQEPQMSYIGNEPATFKERQNGIELKRNGCGDGVCKPRNAPGHILAGLMMRGKKPGSGRKQKYGEQNRRCRIPSYRFLDHRSQAAVRHRVAGNVEPGGDVEVRALVARHLQNYE
jgi:hypothetical protein